MVSSRGVEDMALPAVLLLACGRQSFSSGRQSFIGCRVQVEAWPRMHDGIAVGDLALEQWRQRARVAY